MCNRNMGICFTAVKRIHKASRINSNGFNEIFCNYVKTKKLKISLLYCNDLYIGK